MIHHNNIWYPLKPHISTFPALVVPAVVQDAAELAPAEADDVLGVVVAVLVRHHVGRLHVTRVEAGAGGRHRDEGCYLDLRIPTERPQS